MKFARTIRFDKSDLNIFPLASEEGELAVVGTFSFYNIKAEDLKGKVKQAFSNGFMGCSTFGYSTLVSLVNISEEEIKNACNSAASEEFINKMPKKYDTIVGENGVRLSGGQKQRISIARAILKKSPIILLDDATSSLDTGSEEIVQNAIKNLTKNKTTIVIAHRLSTIHNADKIFFLQGGVLLDSGNHDHLINNCREYKTLYEKQLK